MAKTLPKNALEWGLLILENAPAGIDTVRALKDLFGEFYTDIRKTHTGEATLDELRENIRAKLAQIKENSEYIEGAHADE